VTVYLLADTAAELQEVDTARVLLPLLEELRGRHAGVAMGYCHWGTMDRQRGRVLALLDRWDEAEVALEAGIEQARRFGAPAAVAYGQRDLGMLVLRRGGDGEKARALRLLEEALSLAEGIGMRGLEQSCREHLSAA
jgi:hypothetical protein